MNLVYEGDIDKTALVFRSLSLINGCRKSSLKGIFVLLPVLLDWISWDWLKVYIPLSVKGPVCSFDNSEGLKASSL